MECIRATRALLYAGALPITLGTAPAQDAKQTQTEPSAGTWHTCVILSGSAVAMPPPPNPDASRAELAGVTSQRVRAGGATDRIDYWNRGWPSDHWQEIKLAEA